MLSGIKYKGEKEDTKNAGQYSITNIQSNYNYLL